MSRMHWSRPGPLAQTRTERIYNAAVPSPAVRRRRRKMLVLGEDGRLWPCTRSLHLAPTALQRRRLARLVSTAKWDGRQYTGEPLLVCDWCEADVSAHHDFLWHKDGSIECEPCCLTREEHEQRVAARLEPMTKREAREWERAREAGVD